MLTGKQKRYLRSIIETQPAIFQIGKDSLTENFIMQIENALKARELIKIRCLKTAPDDIQELAFDLAMMTNSEVVQLIGRTIVLYKRGKDAKIILP